jgi:hypothetical protein
MNLVYVYADNEREWNSSEWRCAAPARALNRSGRHHAELVSLNDFVYNTAAAACQAADVIVVQRNLFGPVLTAILHWKARDKVIVADFDDAYHLLPSSSPSYPLWAQGIARRSDGFTETITPPPLAQFRSGLRLVDGATTPSRQLAADWQPITEVRHLPNYIDLPLYESAQRQPHAGVWIGWGGSLGHRQSFTESGLLPALKRVCRARPQVRVMFHGNDRRLFDELPLPATQKQLNPWKPYRAWPQQVAQFDIGLAPLHGAYDQRRSWIKVLEYLVLGVPWLASAGPAYADLAPYGRLVSNSARAWEQALFDLIDHLDEHRARAAGAPRDFGRKQALDRHVETMVELYTSFAKSQSAQIG